MEAMIVELTGVYGRIDGAGRPSATPADFGSPGGAFVVGFSGDEPIACGGVKQLAPGVGEIKRMYVAPAWRGRGVAVALLQALETAASGLGHRSVRLDTGPAQPHAQALYERHGYRPIADYNGNPDACFWGEKILDVTAPDARQRA